jgi:hypothetical protein
VLVLRKQAQQVHRLMTKHGAHDSKPKAAADDCCNAWNQEMALHNWVGTVHETYQIFWHVVVGLLDLNNTRNASQTDCGCPPAASQAWQTAATS